MGARLVPPVLALTVPMLAALSGAAAAQGADGCARFKWSIERERAALATPGLQVVEGGKPLPGIMDPAVVKLAPVDGVAFQRPPGRKPAAATFGAVVMSPPLAVGGAYQITLSDDAWVDVIQDGRELRSTAVSAEPGCPGVRKSLRFTLAAGQATVQISGAAADSVRIDVVPVL